MDSYVGDLETCKDMEANHLETLRKQRTIDRIRERLNTREGRPVQMKTSKDPTRVREAPDLEEQKLILIIIVPLMLMVVTT